MLDNIGKVAHCALGYTGLILRLRKHKDGTGESIVYHGVCLDPDRVGKDWQSVDPRIIGTLDDWVMARACELMMED